MTLSQLFNLVSQASAVYDFEPENLNLRQCTIETRNSRITLPWRGDMFWVSVAVVLNDCILIGSLSPKWPQMKEYRVNNVLLMLKVSVQCQCGTGHYRNFISHVCITSKNRQSFPPSSLDDPAACFFLPPALSTHAHCLCCPFCLDPRNRMQKPGRMNTAGYTFSGGCHIVKSEYTLETCNSP